MIIETRKYMNDDEMMTVVKLKDENGDTLDQLKVYNERKEIEVDSDFRVTAERLDQFLLTLYDLGSTGVQVEFDTQVVNM